MIGAPPERSVPVRPPVLAKGFRPFFLGGAIFAALIVPAWALVLGGRLGTSAYFDPTMWHAHEMVFGFVVAIVAGFLLTAVGNWTHRETAVGSSLFALVALWVAGRVAILLSNVLPSWLVAGTDLAFLPALALAIAVPIVKAKNRRNAIMIVVVTLLWLANLATHLGARRGALVGVDVVTVLMVVITGRVVPMFTRNATKGDADAIRSHAALDIAAVVSVLAVTVGDAIGVSSPFLFGAAAVLVAVRAVHWGTLRTAQVPLLWILHAGYAWIVIGLGLRAAGFAMSGLHAITAGAIGALTLGMMARVSLGHTGRALAPPRSVSIAFAFVLLGAAVRVVSPLVAPNLYLYGMVVSAFVWALAFAVYAAAYAPILTSPRLDGKPG